MKFIRFSEKYKCNDGVLAMIGMIFEEPLDKKDLIDPMIYEFRGNYVRLTPIENDQLSLGSIFDEPEDDFMFLGRKKLIELLDQLEDLTKSESRPIYLIKDESNYRFTDTFPTKYALFLRHDKNYKLIECEDPDLKLLAEFLSHYKKSETHEDFLKDKRMFVEKVDWNLGSIKLKRFANEVKLLNSIGRVMKIEIDDITKLMTEWQKLIKETPEKIYLLLENGEYRLTTQYSPE